MQLDTITIAFSFIIYVILFSVLSALNRRYDIPKWVWLLFEIFGLVLVALPSLLPSDMARFLGSTYVIMCFYSMHSRAWRSLHPHMWRLQTSAANLQSGSFFSVSWEEALDTLFYHSQSYLEPSSASVVAIIPSILHFFATLFVGDGVVFVLFEVMPHYHMEVGDHGYFSSMLMGVWLYCALELAYVGHSLFLEVNELQLTHSMRHRYPVLSTTLSEFWGTRWNPVILKLLQHAFYIPYLHLGGSRQGAAIATFLGSAWLHAFPVYLHSFNIKSSCSVMMFFLLQGLLVVLERAAIEILNHQHHLSIQIRSKSLVDPKRDNDSFCKSQCCVDMMFYIALCISVICTLLSMAPVRSPSLMTSLMPAVAFILVLRVVVRWHLYSEGSKGDTARLGILAVGWCFVFFSLVLTLPLLGLPYLPILQSGYSKSFFTAPLLRALGIYTLYQ